MKVLYKDFPERLKNIPDRQNHCTLLEAIAHCYIQIKLWRLWGRGK